ncbi:alpha-amylase family glycosyl hydrolase [Desulfospira joergensenii]|uniref:alpha-amylase family glycosyl hydrolase n=1 Tax=Desulfospira joergensenii TaxID=53329 RepID=UPI0003B34639|nr:alpha-amylase family glycosyl hydrolase [Desulfospira joergensenii]
MDRPRSNNLSRFVKTVHRNEPDYETELLRLSDKVKKRIKKHLERIYGQKIAKEYFTEIERILKVHWAHKSRELIETEKTLTPDQRFTEKDIILITYGDIIHSEKKSPLQALEEFCDTYLEGTINTIHILPFFPYSSDRGFAVTDFEAVDPRLGSWADIEKLEEKYQLMFDGVVNHVSSHSRWFREFLNSDKYYKKFFITFNSHDDLTPEQRKMIFRPRTSDILTKFYTLDGVKYVWTTFSNDQIDLNYQNPDVLVRVLSILLRYIRRGADILRLDAVTFLWSQPGTRCVHLEQTHEIIRLFRDLFDIVAPGVALITETNVPHQENISYFGNGFDEAHMVYNFALPPLVLHTFYTGDTKAISGWASKLNPPSDQTHFLNFLDSHDGIGLMAAKEILTDKQIRSLADRALEHGGLISFKTGENGTEEPYEINITWYSALNREDDKNEDTAFQVKRFVASRVIPLLLRGVPAIYLHSLIGTQNDIEAVLRTKSNRDINRRDISRSAITAALADPLSKISRINRELGRLLKLRTVQTAFHPNASQKILDISSKIFGVERISVDGGQIIIALVNVTPDICKVCLDLGAYEQQYWLDLVSEEKFFSDKGRLPVTLLPYDTAWLCASA